MISEIKEKKQQFQIFQQVYLQINLKTSDNNIKDYRYKTNNSKCFKISFNQKKNSKDKLVWNRKYLKLINLLKNTEILLYKNIM